MLQYLQQLSYRLRKMLMLLSMHVTSVLFLVRFNNFTLTACMGLYWSYTLLHSSRRSYALLTWLMSYYVKTTLCQGLTQLKVCCLERSVRSQKVCQPFISFERLDGKGMLVHLLRHTVSLPSAF